ncbi:hypothetical protein TRVA0_006S01574 [Trichomonascus vanleenenianus]|uniref:DUF2470 domain-containing protein n=1 Tax=Trichomonascus vanleenenianus TaxID=2268995 RepID=UPI003EC9799A
MSHMNKDHVLSLYDYLGHYGKVDLRTIDAGVPVQMTGLALDHLTLSYAVKNEKKETDIKLDPPMTTLSESRNRLVDMAKDAAKARGYSAYQLTAVTYPKCNNLSEIVVLPLLALLFVAYLVPNPLIFEYLPPPLAGNVIVQRLLAQKQAILMATLMIHSVELWLLMRPILQKYRAQPFVSIKWMIMALLEGYPAVLRARKETFKLEH